MTRLLVDTVRRLVAELTDGPVLGLLGDPAVSVTELNLAVATAGARG